MLTLFGKELRKLRIEHSMKLSVMADGLDVSPSFLTAVEAGRKAIPQDLPARIVKFLRGNKNMLTYLEDAAHYSRDAYKIQIVNEKDREVVAMFAKAFPNFSEDARSKITDILKGQLELDL